MFGWTNSKSITRDFLRDALQVLKEEKTIRNVNDIESAEKQLKHLRIKFDSYEVVKTGAVFYKGDEEVAVWFDEENTLIYDLE
jgi:5'(3')-deoxyribonucleotidase